jgi:hypothetical protein
MTIIVLTGQWDQHASGKVRIGRRFFFGQRYSYNHWHAMINHARWLLVCYRTDRSDKEVRQYTVRFSVSFGSCFVIRCSLYKKWASWWFTMWRGWTRFGLYARGLREGYRADDVLGLLQRTAILCVWRWLWQEDCRGSKCNLFFCWYRRRNRELCRKKSP